MSASTIISDYMSYGLASARPTSPPVSSGVASFYYATDTTNTYVWTGSSWQQVNTGGGSGPSPGTPPTIVQFGYSTTSSTGSTVTLTSTPVSGNLLLAFNTGGGDTANTGWTLLQGSTAGSSYSGIYYKIAGSSESTTQTPTTNTSGNGSTAMWEIHGQNTNPFVFASASTSSGAPFAATPVAPGLTNVMAFGAITGDGSAATFSTNILNMTSDVKSNGVGFGLVAGHSNGSLPVAQGLASLTSLGTRGFLCLVTT